MGLLGFFSGGGSEAAARAAEDEADHALDLAIHHKNRAVAAENKLRIAQHRAAALRTDAINLASQLAGTSMLAKIAVHELLKYDPHHPRMAGLSTPANVPEEGLAQDLATKAAQDKWTELAAQPEPKFF